MSFAILTEVLTPAIEQYRRDVAATRLLGIGRANHVTTMPPREVSELVENRPRALLGDISHAGLVAGQAGEGENLRCADDVGLQRQGFRHPRQHLATHLLWSFRLQSQTAHGSNPNFARKPGFVVVCRRRSSHGESARERASYAKIEATSARNRAIGHSASCIYSVYHSHARSGRY